MQGGGPPGGEEGRWKVEVRVRALAQEVQWLGHKCDEGNRNVALLEDVLEREGGGRRGGSVSSCTWRSIRQH